MSEFRDPAFKLFGRTIPMPPYQETPVAKSVDSLEEVLSQLHPIKPQSDQKNEESEEEQVASAEPTTNSSGLNESSKTDPSNKETPMNATKSLKQEDKENEGNNSEEKTVKKPDKVLPCPRCNSLDTKFCYYNNYNVNQPRHFCKNCQRYWTAGGTMRNVPVGAGRRKNKHSTSQHYRQISVSENLPMVHPDAPDSILSHHPFKPKGSVLSFGSDAPLCKPMASVLNLADKNIAKRNGFHVSEDMKPPVRENGEEHSSASSVTASNLTEERKQGNLQEPLTGNYPGFPPPVPCFPGTPWPPYAAQWNSTPPAFCPSNYPVSFYPAGYWGCAIPAGWSIPWIETGQGLSSSPSSLPITGSNPGSNSPLGKHTRDGNKLNKFTSVKGNTAEERNTESCLWIPKTLRIDDPDEARRSSIWATLGIKNDKADLISGGGMFKAFQSKTEKTTPISDAAQVSMNANPAALSRSINFHENS